ncbi:MAG: transglycosylase SLT domain-containing protein [Aestuariivirga sp.]
MKKPNVAVLQILLALFLGAGAASTFSSALAAGSPVVDMCESHLERFSRQENVPLGVLYAVGLTETGKKGRLHPYSLNVEGESLILGSKEEALQAFVIARKKGKKLIDLGCMQVNHYYHRKNFDSVEAMLDPEANIRYAAKLLKKLKQDNGSWTMAVALYHASPRNKKAQRRYVCAVIGNLVATGFGGWTQDSRKFCGR